MPGKLFEYAALYHPKPKKVGDQDVTDPSVVIIEPKRVVAKDPAGAGILAARDIPADYLDKLDDVEILVRPF